MGAIFSIGHGNRTLQDILHILEEFNIELLVDIRSKPFSRWNPQVNRTRLYEKLGDRYLWLGKELGGLSGERPPGYKTGLQKLIELSKTKNICIMCSELDPAKCHREKWIARDLAAMGVKVYHILPNGDILTGYQTTL